MYKDKIDDEILKILKDDSRESFVDIGKKLKLSESAVRRRVKNLSDAKIIKKFTIEIKISYVKLRNIILLKQDNYLL